MPEASSYNVIIASREIQGSNRQVPQSFPRRLVGRSFSHLVEMILGLGITDTQCGFKMFSEDAAKKIFNSQKLNGWGFDVELLYLAKKYGFKIKEIPVTWINDRNTKVRWHAPFGMFRDILKIRFNGLFGRYR
jgi:dolichyl-phosphate beta-glucosyltransferase